MKEGSCSQGYRIKGMIVVERSRLDYDSPDNVITTASLVACMMIKVIAPGHTTTYESECL